MKWLNINRRRILAFLRFGGEAAGKFPRKDDPWPEKLIKLLAIGDAAQEAWGGKATVFEGILARHTLIEKASEPFVKLFFGTPMAKGFKITRTGLNDNLELIEAESPDGERLFFQEYRYGFPEIAPMFFHTPGFDFASAMATLWVAYPHGLYLSIRPRKHNYGNDVTFCSVPAPRGEVTSSKAAARIAAGVEALQARAGEPWCFLAYGPPGTGKSSYCLEVNAATGGRLLKIDASSIPHLGVNEINFLLDAIRPSFLLVDDFDEAPGDETKARLRFLFEHLHDAHGDITVAVTVNDPSKLDEALIRSERIDDVLEFPAPDEAERKELLQKLSAKHEIGLKQDSIDDLAVKTDGFNHADLAAFVRRLRRKSVEESLDDLLRLRALAAQAKDAEDEETEEEDEDDFEDGDD